MNRFEATMAVTLLSLGALGGAKPGVLLAQSHSAPVLRGGIDPGRTIGIDRVRHNVFGTIVSIARTRTDFVMRTRGGRLFAVDGAEAMASGRFSAPLFIGKVVLVSGGIDARHVLHATAVTRMTRLDARTPADT